MTGAYRIVDEAGHVIGGTYPTETAATLELASLVCVWCGAGQTAGELIGGDWFCAGCLAFWPRPKPSTLRVERDPMADVFEDRAGEERDPPEREGGDDA